MLAFRAVAWECVLGKVGLRNRIASNVLLLTQSCRAYTVSYLGVLFFLCGPGFSLGVHPDHRAMVGRGEGGCVLGKVPGCGCWL